MEAGVLFVLVLGLLFLGVPIAIALGLSSVLTVAFFSSDSVSSVALQLFNASRNYTLLAIPFFVLASAFMSTGGVARRIIRFAIACVGHIRGGLAIAAVFSCMLFAALSGSSPATVVAIGTIAIAGMRQVGYTKEFAAGVIANAGTLGILIPPSIVMVVYAAATDVSVGRMFLAGVIPGLVAGLMLMVAIYINARIKNMPKQPFVGIGEVAAAAWEAGFGLLLIVIILGGIYGGIFTPTEAASVAAVYAFLIAIFIYRDMGPLKDVPMRKPGEAVGTAILRNLWLTVVAAIPACFHADTRKVLVDAGKTTIMLMFIIVNALLFAHVLTSERIPQAITDWMVGAGFTWFTFLIAVNIMLLMAASSWSPRACC
jgi:C4-dicarboxylate transporter DctM subunit